MPIVRAERHVYGLVNKAVEDMVRSRYGPDTWEAIHRKAGVGGEGFLSLSVYPDEWTYKLVAAASEVLGLSPDAVLEAFGEYWVLETAQKHYGEFMRLSGRNLPDFLQNLDQMHARIELSFRDMRAPSFRCTDRTESSLVLHYQSSRTGLLPFVVGLLKGLGQWFGTPASVEVLARREDGADHDVLRITTGAVAA